MTVSEASIKLAQIKTVLEAIESEGLVFYAADDEVNPKDIQELIVLLMEEYKELLENLKVVTP